MATARQDFFRNRRLFVFVALAISTFIVDILLVKIYDTVDKYFITVEAKSVLFLVNSLLCLVFQYGIIRSLQNIIFQQHLVKMKIKSFYVLLLGSLTVSFILVGILTFQIFYYEEFKTVILIIFIVASYSVCALLLIKLDILFFRWFRLYHNFAILLYFIAISLIILNLVVTALYASIRITDRPPETRQFVGGSIDISIGRYEKLQTIQKISSILSFVSIWLATSVLLVNYKDKSIKTVAYWLILSIPLLYFVVNYFSTIIFRTIFFPYLNDPILSALILTAFLTLSKPIGGLTFGILFWKMSHLVSYEKSIRLYMIISGLGILLIFSADQAGTISLVPYPPFGLATVSLLPMGAYMMLVGIYNTATLVSKNIDLRKSVHKLAIDLKLLKGIGEAERDKEIQKIANKIMKERSLTMDDTEVRLELDETELVAYVKLILSQSKK